MKKIISIILIATIAIMGLVACNELSASAEENYIAVDYEEAGVQFVTDSKDEILSFSMTNLEGEELLLDEDYTGENVYDAIEDITANALELGYIDVDADQDNPNAVLVTVDQFRNTVNQRYRENVKERVKTIMMNKGVWALVLEAEDIEELRNLGQEYGISTAKARMVKAAQLRGEDISFESIQECTPAELAEKVKKMRPIIAEINKLESEISELENELEGLSEDVTRYDEIVATLATLESELETYQEDYDAMVIAREQKRILNQERIQAHRNEIEEKVNAIRERRQNNERFSDQIRESKRTNWEEILQSTIFNDKMTTWQKH